MYGKWYALRFSPLFFPAGVSNLGFLLYKYSPTFLNSLILVQILHTISLFVSTVFLSIFAFLCVYIYICIYIYIYTYICINTHTHLTHVLCKCGTTSPFFSPRETLQFPNLQSKSSHPVSLSFILQQMCYFFSSFTYSHSCMDRCGCCANSTCRVAMCILEIRLWRGSPDAFASCLSVCLSLHSYIWSPSDVF